MRRITSIALVHETLTEEFEGAVDMADVARRIVKMLAGSLGREDATSSSTRCRCGWTRPWPRRWRWY